MKFMGPCSNVGHVSLYGPSIVLHWHHVELATVGPVSCHSSRQRGKHKSTKIRCKDHIRMAGWWWYTYPSEKYDSVNWDDKYDQVNGNKKNMFLSPPTRKKSSTLYIKLHWFPFCHKTSHDMALPLCHLLWPIVKQNLDLTHNMWLVLRWEYICVYKYMIWLYIHISIYAWIMLVLAAPFLM